MLVSLGKQGSMLWSAFGKKGFARRALLDVRPPMCEKNRFLVAEEHIKLTN